MKIKSIKPIKPELSNCISVASDDKLFAVGEKGALLTHNSVLQRSIILGALLRPESWIMLGIDLKRVELSPYREFGMNVATDLETAIEFLRFGQAVMMKRYEEMEKLGINNFQDMPEKSQALMIMVDEAGELLSPSGVKALSENTLVCTPDGLVPLKDINVGDFVLDIYGNPTEVTQKYEPESQERYELVFANGLEKESFIAGAEHLWVAYIEYTDKEIQEKIVNTAELFELKADPKVKEIKFKRYEEN